MYPTSRERIRRAICLRIGNKPIAPIVHLNTIEKQAAVTDFLQDNLGTPCDIVEVDQVPTREDDVQLFGAGKRGGGT